MVASTSDYLPTILEAVGVRYPDNRPIDGISLLPALRGKTLPRSKPLAFETTRITRGSPKLALIENRFKLLTELDGSPDQLYDISSDPTETKNIATRYPADVARMRKDLSAWRESCKRSNSGADYVKPQ
jgi:arylsulfatase A-like enzyme